LGIAFFKLKETEKALEAYNQALKIKPDYEYIYYNIGLLYEVDKEDLETALKYYEEALRLNENFTYALQAMRDVRQKLEYIKLNKQKKDVSDFETQIICKKCGNINRASAKFCDECGESIH
jgi:tetratricopeptide (TPR) repeat protein